MLPTIEQHIGSPLPAACIIRFWASFPLPRLSCRNFTFHPWTACPKYWARIAPRSMGDDYLNGKKYFEKLYLTFEQSWDIWKSWRLFDIKLISWVWNFCHRQSKDLASNPSAVESVIFSTERFSNSLNIIWYYSNNLWRTFFNFTLHFKSLPYCNAFFNIRYITNY